MPRPRPEGVVTIRQLENSGEFVEVVPNWSVPTWAECAFTDTSGTYPSFVARAGLTGPRKALRPSVLSVHVEQGGKPVTSAQLTALARVSHKLAAMVLSQHVTVLYDGQTTTATADEFDKAMRAALRRPVTSQTEREDECLSRWETEFQPGGMTQRQAAEAMGLGHSTFRQYLFHARKRRGY